MTVVCTLFDADGVDQPVELSSELVEELNDRQLLWVDVASPDDGELRLVAAALDLEGQTLQNLLHPIGRPRLDILGNYFEMNVVAIDEAERAMPLDLVAGRNWIATFHRDQVAFIDEFRSRLGPDTELGRLNAPSFMAALLDWQVGSYFASVDEIEREVDRLDDRALREPDDDVLRELIRMRRRIASIRRTLTPHREVFAALARPDFEIVATSESAAHFRALASRLERAIGAVENARELLIGSFDILMTQTSVRTNDVMRALTIITVILLPAVVLAGVMGMNFRVAFFDDPSMFWVVIGGMVALAAVVLVVARRNEWI